VIGISTVILACGALLDESAQTEAADAVFINANIHTLDAEGRRAEGLAVRGGRLVAVGRTGEILRLRGDATAVHDLGGRTVLPGLIDAHGHMAGLGSFGLGRLDLSQVSSFDDMVAIVAERARAARPGEWILGGRWDHESWPQRALPTHARLSEVSPDNPVWLTRVDGHAGIANAAALRRAGVSRETSEPAGGAILRDERGELTGVLVDNAMRLVTEAIDARQPDTLDLLRKAQELCLAAGLTGVHDAGITPADVEAYRELERRGELKLRVYGMIAAPYALFYFREKGLLVGERLTVRACKLYADGAMGSRGAWLLAPYADRPADDDGRPYAGLATMEPTFIRQVAEDGLRRGYQVCTHAIGDRGNRETLDAYEAALRATPRPDHRFRIEHAQLLSPADIPRFAKLGVIASMQPTHCTSDMRWVEARVGAERARGAYAWASLLRSGARIAGGSDFPVESHNPFLGLYAAATRQTADGRPEDGWNPQERVSREEALRMMTLDAAHAAFEEDRKGALRPGLLADFIVVDRDVLTCPPRDILATRVLMTVIGGEVVYRAP
jgi:predicted amidohydrolase YtcJ